MNLINQNVGLSHPTQQHQATSPDACTETTQLCSRRCFCAWLCLQLSRMRLAPTSLASRRFCSGSLSANSEMPKCYPRDSYKFYCEITLFIGEQHIGMHWSICIYKNKIVNVGFDPNLHGWNGLPGYQWHNGGVVNELQTWSETWFTGLLRFPNVTAILKRFEVKQKAHSKESLKYIKRNH